MPGQTAISEIPTRETLLMRLKNWSDNSSWQAFFDTYWELIYHAAVRAGLTDAEAQDVVQETVISVCKSMPGFDYKSQNGSFKGWLLRLTHWRVNDQLRKRQKKIKPRDKRKTSLRTDTLANVPEPLGPVLDRVWDEEWEKALLDAAISKVKRLVDEKHYQVFDLYNFKKWPIARIARAMHINSGRINLINHRIKKLIKTELEQLQKDSLPL